MKRERSVMDHRLARLPFMAMAMLALLAGLWAGLLRLGWSPEMLRPTLTMTHGPLMVCAFLGTLISLERAVALGRGWGFAAPAVTGVGGVLLIAGAGSWQGPALIAAGSLILVLVFATVLKVKFQPFAVVMGLGAVAWLAGNVLWLLGEPVFRVVGWWLGFLVLTIAGERLELSRVLLHAPRVERLFLALVGLLGAGLVVASFTPGPGMRLVGASLVLLALWLLRYDVARHTVGQTGLTRFIAVSLLSGYGWLIAGGLLMLRHGGVTAGPVYDALLHAVFVGFVFSMVFGHAPIIFPSVLGVPVAYRPLYYGHLVLLHLSLMLRVGGDLGGVFMLQRWGGLLNAAAIALFLVMTVYSVFSSRTDPVFDQPAGETPRQGKRLFRRVKTSEGAGRA